MMMAYKSDFVLAVLHQGTPVREIGRTVHLPFDAEYKVRLKNKHHSLRAKAKVFIDGRPVSNLGDFILKAGETLDLERFLDQSMSSGNRFKFVPLSDGRVNDPTDAQNGLVRVEFYRELAYDYSNQIFWNQPKTPLRGDPTWTSRKLTASDDVSWTINTTGGPVYSNHTLNSINVQSNVIACSASVPGATVEGSLSGQAFAYGDFFATEVLPVVIELSIRGFEKQPQVVSGPAQKISPQNQPKVRFCSNCGKRRSKMADKFCPRCGDSYKG